MLLVCLTASCKLSEYNLTTVTSLYQVGEIPSHEGHSLVYKLEDNLYPVLAVYIVDLYYNETIILVKCYSNPLKKSFEYKRIDIGYSKDNSQVFDLSLEEFQRLITNNAFEDVMHFNDFD